MSGDGITIEGLTAVKAKLESLATDKADKCIRRALRAGAKVEQAAIVEYTPERPPLPSGTAMPPGALKNDIVIETHKSDQGNLYAVVKPGDATIHVRLWVEEGHRLVRGGYSKEIFKDGQHTGKYRGPGKEVRTIEPHPYVREAFEASEDEVARTIAETLKTEIAKAAKAK
jgi:HK97 gp10 family phage protein